MVVPEFEFVALVPELAAPTEFEVHVDCLLARLYGLVGSETIIGGVGTGIGAVNEG